MLVASLLLLGACSGSSGSDGAKDKTSTTAAPATQTTKKPGGGKIGQKKETVAYCNTIRANKGKFSLKNRAAAAEAAALGYVRVVADGSRQSGYWACGERP